MSAFSRLAIGASAILVVSVAGCSLIDEVRPPNRLTMTPDPTTSARTDPIPSALDYTWPSKLEAGTYATSLLWDVPFTTTFTIPAGWTGMDLEIRKDPAMLVGFLVVDGVYADPCGHRPLDPAPDGTIGDLAEAVAKTPGIQTTPAVPASYGGASGLSFELEIEPNQPCSLDAFALWHPADEPRRTVVHTGGLGPWPAWLPHHRVSVLDIAGTRYVIDAAWSDDATPADRAELQSILDSISIR